MDLKIRNNFRIKPHYSLFKFHTEDIENLRSEFLRQIAAENVTKIVSVCSKVQEIGVNF